MLESDAFRFVVVTAALTVQFSVKYEDGPTMTFTVKRVSSFLASAQSVAESEKVEIDGVQWQIVAKTFIENGTTYLAYYLRGSKAGNWRRWIKADFHIYNTVFGESLSNELRISAPADHYAEWGFDKFISAEVCHSTVCLLRAFQMWKQDVRSV